MGARTTARGRGGRSGKMTSFKGDRGPRKPKPDWHVDVNIPKKKYSITFGYLGNGYKGMAQQINPETGGDLERTIEGDLLLAMKRADLLPKEYVGSMGRLNFSRVGRTDKGVHAAGQLVALKASLGAMRDELKLERRSDPTLPAAPDQDDHEFFTKTLLSSSEELLQTCVSALQAEYPSAFVNREKGFDDVQGFKNLLWQAGRELDATNRLQRELDSSGRSFRVHGICRTTNGFDARRFASGRHYEYLLPSWLLCPVKVNRKGFPELDHIRSHGSRTFVEVGCITREELAKQHEVNQPDATLRTNPRKVQSFLTPFTEKETEEAIQLGCVRRWRKISGTVPPVVPFSSDMQTVPERPLWENADPSTLIPTINDPIQPLDGASVWRHNVYDVLERLKYRLDETDLERLRNVLKTYQGTHSFHNYTSGLKAGDPSAIRFMNNIDVELVDDASGEQLVIVRLHGQSFLLNQIRKMIGLAVEVFRGSAAPWAIEEAFSLDVKRYVPMAPAEGLLLDVPDYEAYNINKAAPPNTPYLPGSITSTSSANALLSTPDDAGEADQKVLADDAFGSLTPHMRHVFNITEDIRVSTDAFKREVVYEEVLRTVREAWKEQLEPDAFKPSDVSPWRMFMLDLDWHPYDMENLPSGRVPIQNSRTATEEPFHPEPENDVQEPNHCEED